jgi:hypothetical protein
MASMRERDRAFRQIDDEGFFTSLAHQMRLVQGGGGGTAVHVESTFFPRKFKRNNVPYLLIADFIFNFN